MIYDKDLVSIQEVRTMVKKAKTAQEILKKLSQEQIDSIVQKVAIAGEKYAKELARMAVEETGFGKYEDKVVKNTFASSGLFDYMKDMKTVGVVHEDLEKKTLEVAVPVGVIGGLIPCTNPTSTTIYKCMIALKSANTIVLSPHPSAKQCIIKTCEILSEAAKRAGAPENIFQCMSVPTLEGTKELMSSVDLILATGGRDMVRAAYSSGVPALGVGPGNVPAFIEKTANIPLAVSRIIQSKTFDNGVICASEQAIVTEASIKEEVKRACLAEGCYFLDEEEASKVGKTIAKANGKLNAKIVGRSALQIAEMAGITVPSSTKVLVYEEKGVGINYPFSMEKLSPILAFYTEQDWVSGCNRCIELLKYGGEGHTLSIHSQDETLIREFALKKPASRILINTSSTHGAIGATTNIAPALTLGCGAIGGSATSDNVTARHLINIRHVAYGVREVSDLVPKNEKVAVQDDLTKVVTGVAQSTGSLEGINIEDIVSLVKEALLKI